MEKRAPNTDSGSTNFRFCNVVVDLLEFQFAGPPENKMGVVQREPNVDNKQWHQPDHLFRAESKAKIKICGALQEENCCDLDPTIQTIPVVSSSKSLICRR
ncbi:hypothetical protein Tcan_10937 [Toxocara canis]|uniref:Uncharacterized protein n=1 Tax=Toxocara canis TaxID=6265 RepID=A0A0B2V725_TOXCA|nr:hypothetical protein Tcan_10937 [Toxocara canis]